MNQQMLLPKQDLHKINPVNILVNILSWTRVGPMHITGELLTADRSWEMNSQFSLRVWALVGCFSLIDGPIPITIWGF